MRSLVDAVGLRVERKPGLMIVQAISELMYNDEQLQTARDAILASRQMRRGASSSSTIQVENTTPTATISSDYDICRTVDATARHFANQEKYSGILAESPSLSEMRSNYLTYCRDKNMSHIEKVKLIHYALKGPAWTYWSEELQNNPNMTSLGVLFQKLAEKFDTPAHQRQVEHILESLNIDQIRNSLGCGRVKALGHIYHEVDRLNSQVTRNKRGDTFKSEQLMKIVENRVWSQEAKKKLLQGNIKFAELYSELSASALLWEEKTRKLGADPENTSDLSVADPPAPRASSIFYGARYANSSPSYKNRSQRKFIPKPVRQHKSKESSKCFRCGKYGHYAFECSDSDRTSMIEAIRGRIRDTKESPDKAAARILFELATAYDDSGKVEEVSDEETELVENTFEALLNSSVSGEENNLEHSHFSQPDSE